jgi:hypothetical protein
MRRVGKPFRGVRIIIPTEYVIRQEEVVKMQGLQDWEFQLFERVAAYSCDDPSDELGAVMALLNIEIESTLIGRQLVQGVLAECPWREASSPKEYVRTVVTARAPKTHIDRPKPGLVKSKAGRPRSYSTGRKRPGPRFTSLANNELDQLYGDSPVSDRAHDNEHEADRNCVFMPREYLKPPDLPAGYVRAVEEFNRNHHDRHIHLPPLVYNWKKLAEDAGLSSGEVMVVEYQSRGLSRDAALAEQPNDMARKELQAAWKRYDRSGKKKLREFIKKVREEATLAEEPNDMVRKELQAAWKRYDDEKKLREFIKKVQKKCPG